MGRKERHLGKLYSILLGPTLSNWIAQWSPQESFQTSKVTVWERRSNLGGMELVNCIRFFATMVIEVKDEDGNLKGSTGLVVFVV